MLHSEVSLLLTRSPKFHSASLGSLSPVLAVGQVLVAHEPVHKRKAEVPVEDAYGAGHGGTVT
jgi:hypothetical protein